MNRKTIATMPEWLAEAVQSYQTARGLNSEGAALLELVALGLHHVSKHESNALDFGKDVESRFGNEYEVWYDAGNKNQQPELLDDLEWYVVSELLRQQWGGNRK